LALYFANVVPPYRKIVDKIAGAFDICRFDPGQPMADLAPTFRRVRLKGGQTRNEVSEMILV
jgi:hypothetical protein